MEIKSVKLQSNGYLLNGEMSVPMADGNREYEAIKEWLKDNTPEPEFTEEELAQQEINKKIQEAKVYLANTDYKMLPDYTPRPDGEPIEEIKIKRAESRETIRQLEQGEQ